MKLRTLGRRHPGATLAFALPIVVLTACGATGVNTEHLSLSSARGCLAAAGFRVAGGFVSKEASNGSGAVGELVVPGAFVAFYPSAAIAGRAATQVEKNVARLRGSMVRRGNATVAIVGTPLTAAQRRRLLGCLR